MNQATANNPIGTARDWHNLDSTATLTALDSDSDRGLTATQVRDRLIKFGPNELQETAGRTNWQILLDQFTNIMLVMLIVIAVISGGLDFLDWQANKLKPGEIPFKDTIAIMSIVFLNGLLGYLQESGAEKALAALKKMSAPRVRVVRDGEVGEIDGKDVVPGDIIFLEAGVQPAADARLLEEANLQVREAALTGEAEAVNKQIRSVLPVDTVLGDRTNVVYQGTEIVSGRGKAIVTSTGMQTELGKIAAMLQAVESEPTPLQQRMTQLGNVLVSGSLILVGITIAIGVIQELLKNTFDWNVIKELIEVSLSMAVAVVPEGLPAVITVTLALGTQRMVKRQALIRKLTAVETLGSVTTICSDKTGTLTQNKMVVREAATLDRELYIDGEGYEPNGKFTDGGETIDPQSDETLKALLLGCVLCNDAILKFADNTWQIIGDPTEGALLAVGGKAGIDRPEAAKLMPRAGELPFDSDRKRMSVICQRADGGYVVFTKGSPEIVLSRCSHIQSTTADKALAVEASHKETILRQNDRLAGNGLRVLGFAYKYVDTIPTENDIEGTENDLIWLGLVGMLDAPRPEVRDAVARCRAAGIRPIMITGDHQLTASAIAKDLGITTDDRSRAVTGQEIAQMSQEELESIVGNTNVFARVAPEHKLRIVQALQKRGQFAAMTGDGVNDAPALKQADIGIAMGITGTDVSKEASDMVLLDDNFATIVAATEEGRVVYDNIRRFIKYILGSNIGEVLTIAAAPLMGLGGVPMTPLQILWMNLVTDGLPALALAVEPAEPDTMKRPPISPKESIFARGLGNYMVRIGIIFGIVTIVMMKWAYDYTNASGYTGNKEEWKTMVFTTLCIAQMFHALAARSDRRLIIETNPMGNPYLLWAVLVTTALQIALIYFPPFQSFFGTHALSGLELAVCIGFSLLMLIWIEGEKIFFRVMKK
jgi:P-type Ca2+ transporter type 2C